MDPDELEIAAAVRMSMSIPIFFDPVVYHDPRKPHDQRLIVDGGLLSNFPVWLFDTPADHVPRWPTFGLLLVAPNQQAPLVAGDEPERTDEGKVSILGFLLAIGAHDDGGARPPVRRAGQLRADDPDQHARRADHAVQHRRRSTAQAQAVSTPGVMPPPSSSRPGISTPTSRRFARAISRLAGSGSRRR